MMVSVADTDAFSSGVSMRRASKIVQLTRKIRLRFRSGCVMSVTREAVISLKRFVEISYQIGLAISNRIGALRALIKKMQEFTDASH
jgi:hypothetical protein